MNLRKPRRPHGPLIAVLPASLLLPGCQAKHGPEPPDPAKMQAADEAIKERDQKMLEAARRGRPVGNNPAAR